MYCLEIFRVRLNRSRNTARAKVVVVVVMMAAALILVSGLTVMHTLPVEGSRPRNNDNDDSPTQQQQQRQPVPQSMGTSPNSQRAGDSHFTTQPLTTLAVGASTNSACGQVVSGVINLTANLNWSRDGIIVDGPNTVINTNGFSITGPGQEKSKLLIMVPSLENVVIKELGSINGFQDGVLLTGTNGFKNRFCHNI